MIAYLESGISRHVFSVGPYVVKIPRTDRWTRFLHGLLGNMQEATCGRLGWPELCPVVFALPGGFAVVMRRARVCTDAEFAVAPVRELLDRAAAEERHVGSIVELKSDSWGWLDGRLVAVDYG